MAAIVSLPFLRQRPRSFRCKVSRLHPVPFLPLDRSPPSLARRRRMFRSLRLSLPLPSPNRRSPPTNHSSVSPLQPLERPLLLVTSSLLLPAPRSDPAPSHPDPIREEASSLRRNPLRKYLLLPPPLRVRIKVSPILVSPALDDRASFPLRRLRPVSPFKLHSRPSFFNHLRPPALRHKVRRNDSSRSMSEERSSSLSLRH